MDFRTTAVGALAFAVLSGALASAANASVTFGSASITTSTAVQVKRGITVKNSSDSQTISIPLLPPNPAGTVSAAVAVIKTGVVNNIQANARSTAVAYFADAASGTFDGNSGTSIVQGSASTLGNPISAFAKAGDYDFLYNFTLSRPTAFQLDFELDDPNTPGSNTVFAVLSGPVGGFSNGLSPNSSGSILSSLSAGAYSLHLSSAFEDVITRTSLGIGQTTGKSIDHFSFALTETAVPEPASWALMITGFAVAGAALRRRPTLALS